MELKESLEICVKMWEWLAEHPDKDKTDAILELHLPRMQNECACCEYYEAFSADHNCPDLCPLTGLWESSDQTEGCMNDDSLWRKWERAKTDQKSEYAERIAAAARRRLEDFTY